MKRSLVGNVHLLAGGADAIPELLSLLRAEGVETEGNPDMYVRSYSAFGIDEARELRARAQARAIGGARRIFLIATPGMTHEAQNALLKTLEEPPADAAFFFLVPAPETLLSTFRSRAQMLVLDRVAQEEHAIDAATFLAAAPQKRLDMLKPLLEKGDDPSTGLGTGKRDIGSILTFLSSLERKISSSVLGNTKRDALEAVYRARKFMGDKGALIKPLLEQLALLVPVV